MLLCKEIAKTLLDFSVSHILHCGTCHGFKILGRGTRNKLIIGETSPFLKDLPRFVSSYFFKETIFVVLEVYF